MNAGNAAVVVKVFYCGRDVFFQDSCYMKSEAAFARRKRRKAAGGNRKGRFPPDPLLSFAACIRGCFAGRLGLQRGALNFRNNAEAPLCKFAATAPVQAVVQPLRPGVVSVRRTMQPALYGGRCNQSIPPQVGADSMWHGEEDNVRRREDSVSFAHGSEPKPTRQGAQDFVPHAAPLCSRVPPCLPRRALSPG